MLSEWDTSGRRGRCTGTVDLSVCNTRNEELIEAHIATCNCRLSNVKSCPDISHTSTFICSILRPHYSKSDRKKIVKIIKAIIQDPKALPLTPKNQPFKQQGQGQHYLLLFLANQLHIPIPVKRLTSTTTRTPMPGNSPVHLMRGIDRVGLPRRVGVFFWGRGSELEEEGEGVVVKNLGWRKNLG